MKVLEYNIVFGINKKDPFLSSEERNIKKVKYLYIKKNDRVLIQFPFDFEIGKTGRTEIKDLDTQSGKKNGFMYQIINKDANQQLSLKVPNECLKNAELKETNGSFEIEIKDNFKVAVSKQYPNQLLCEKVS